MAEIKIENYMQGRPPIKQMMTEAVNAMKGADRSMADFAAATGLSTSMLFKADSDRYSSEDR